jgi:molecular chaperone GrpE
VTAPESTGGQRHDQAEGAGTAGAPAGAGVHGHAEPHYAEGGPGASSEPGGYEEYDHEPLAADAKAADAKAADAKVTESAERAEPAESDLDREDEVEEGADLAEEERLAASLMVDLQRLQAEYVNYKKRVDRDREVIRTHAVNHVVEALLPVLDDIHMARQAGDLTDGPFAAIADKLEATLGKYGIERIGEPGEEFDPNVHEALMHVQAELPEGAAGTTVVQVLQPGYRNGDRVIRAARVSVADPE